MLCNGTAKTSDDASFPALGGFCQDDAATDATDAPAVTDSAAVPARGDGDPTDAPGGDPQTPIEISVPTIFPLGGKDSRCEAQPQTGGAERKWVERG